MTDEEQELIDLLWKDYSPETATKVAAQCATEEERDHALWIAVALQRAAAASAILAAGTNAVRGTGPCRRQPRVRPRR
jgi:hypothetical protein